MCLTCIKSIKLRKTKGKYLGWKVFEKRQNKFISLFYGSSVPYSEEQWIYDISRDHIGTHESGLYPSGFHVFTNKKDAIIWAGLVEKGRVPILGDVSTVVKRVEYRNVQITGVQWIKEKEKRFSIVVVREMKILPDKEESDE